MLVITRASPVQFLRDVRRVRHEPGGLEDGSLRRAYFPSSRGHAELAHVSPHYPHVVLGEELGDALEVPTRRKPRVLVDEVATLFSLMIIYI